MSEPATIGAVGKDMGRDPNGRRARWPVGGNRPGRRVVEMVGGSVGPVSGAARYGRGEGEEGSVVTGRWIGSLAARVLTVAAVLALAGAACSAEEPAGTATRAPSSPGGWSELPHGPLSARVPATGVWTGTELVVLGGSDAPQCGWGADCFVPANPLADGAALELGTGEWRRLPDVPTAFATAQSVWTGRLVLVAAQTTFLDPARALLALDPATDTWSMRAAPPGDITGDPVWTGDQWIFPAVPGSGDWHYLPDEDRWEQGSPDPLGRLTERQLAWADGRLVAIGSRYEDHTTNGVYRAAVAGPRRHDLAGAARLGHLEQRRYLDRHRRPRRQPDVGHHRAHRGRRPLPHGGVLDLSSGTWSDLPDPAPWTAHRARAGDRDGLRRPGGRLGRRRPDPAANGRLDLGRRRSEADRADPGVAVWTGTELPTWGGVVHPEEPGTAAPELSDAGYTYRLPST